MKARVRGLAGLVAAGAVLVVGWPLLGGALGSDLEPLRAGDTLTLGTGRDAARFAVGRGWSLRKVGSDPAQSYKLERPATELSLSLVSPPAGVSLPRLWAGLARTARITAPGAVLGEPRPYRGGLRGTIEEGGVSGVATVLPGPGGAAVVEAVALGGAPADQDAAAGVVGSIEFDEGQR